MGVGAECCEVEDERFGRGQMPPKVEQQPCRSSSEGNLATESSTEHQQREDKGHLACLSTCASRIFFRLAFFAPASQSCFLPVCCDPSIDCCCRVVTAGKVHNCQYSSTNPASIEAQNFCSTLRNSRIQIQSKEPNEEALSLKVDAPKV
jgi:hypothetical protein